MADDLIRYRIRDAERRAFGLEDEARRAQAVLRRAADDLRRGAFLRGYGAGWGFGAGARTGDGTGFGIGPDTPPPPPTPTGPTTYGIATYYHPSFTTPLTPVAGVSIYFRSPYFAPYDYDDLKGTTGSDGTLSFSHPTVTDWVTYPNDAICINRNRFANRYQDGTATAPVPWQLSPDDGHAFFFSQSNAPVVWNGTCASDSALTSGLTCQDRSGAASTATYSYLAAPNTYVLYGFGHTSFYNDPPYGSSSHRYRIYGMNSADVRSYGAAFVSVEFGVLVSGVWHAYETGSLTSLNPSTRTATFHFTNTHTWDGAALGDVTFTLT